MKCFPKEGVTDRPSDLLTDKQIHRGAPLLKMLEKERTGAVGIKPKRVNIIMQRRSN